MAEEKHHETLLRTRSSKPERKRSATTIGYEERRRSNTLSAFELKGIEIVPDAENPKTPKVLGKGAYGAVIELRFRGGLHTSFYWYNLIISDSLFLL